MARSDLVVALAKAGNAGDKRGARVATEAIIAEERAKQHKVLAEKLSKTMHMNGNGAQLVSASPDASSRGRDYIMEITPRRRLEDIILSAASRGAVDQLIEEQLRGDLLRAHGMEPRHRILLVGPPGTGKTPRRGHRRSGAVPLLVVRYESMIGSYLAKRRRG